MQRKYLTEHTKCTSISLGAPGHDVLVPDTRAKLKTGPPYLLPMRLQRSSPLPLTSRAVAGLPAALPSCSRLRLTFPQACIFPRNIFEGGRLHDIMRPLAPVFLKTRCKHPPSSSEKKNTLRKLYLHLPKVCFFCAKSDRYVRTTSTYDVHVKWIGSPVRVINFSVTRSAIEYISADALRAPQGETAVATISYPVHVNTAYKVDECMAVSSSSSAAAADVRSPRI